MARYAAFGYSTFYPDGGWDDLLEPPFATEQAAVNRAEAFLKTMEGSRATGQVVDLTTATVVWSKHQ